MAALSAGSTSARMRSGPMPTCAAIACAVARRSPVIIQTSSPARCSRATASADAGFTVSATAMQAQQGAVARHEHRRGTVARRLGRERRRAGRCRCPRRPGSGSVPTRIVVPSTVARTPRPATASKAVAFDRLDRRAHRRGARSPRPGDARCRARRPRRRGAARASEIAGPELDARDRGLAAGDRAGLVEHDGRDRLRPLQCGAVADQDAVLGALAGADHDRRRGGQAHGARAGDDEHRDRARQRVGQPRLGAEQHPAGEGRRGDDDHDRHEPARDPVGDALDRRLGALRPLDERHDLRRGSCRGRRAPRGARTSRSCSWWRR